MYLFRRSLQELRQVRFESRSVGSGTTLRRLLHLVKHTVYTRADYFLMSHDLESFRIAPDTEGSEQIAVRMVGSRDDIDRLSRMSGLSDFIPDPIDWLKRVYDDDGIGFVAFHQGEPVGCSWISFRATRKLMRVPVPMTPGDAYLHSLFVDREKRNLGCGRILSMRRLQYLREKGYKKAKLIVLKGNAPALRVDRVLGYRVTGEITHVRVLLWDFYRSRNLRSIDDRRHQSV